MTLGFFRGGGERIFDDSVYDDSVHGDTVNNAITYMTTLLTTVNMITLSTTLY